jgi:hypothetical protein
MAEAKVNAEALPSVFSPETIYYMVKSSLDWPLEVIPAFQVWTAASAETKMALTLPIAGMAGGLYLGMRMARYKHGITWWAWMYGAGLLGMAAGKLAAFQVNPLSTFATNYHTDFF